MGPVIVIFCKVNREVGAFGGITITLLHSVRLSLDGMRYLSKAFRVIVSVFDFLEEQNGKESLKALLIKNVVLLVRVLHLEQFRLYLWHDPHLCVLVLVLQEYVHHQPVLLECLIR